MVIVLISRVEIQWSLEVLGNDGVVDLSKNVQLVVCPQRREITVFDFSHALVICEVNAEVQIAKQYLVVMLLRSGLEELLREVKRLIDNMLYIAQTLLGLALATRQVAV